MADAEGGDYICPACSAPVEPDWHACASCGVEFAPPEGGQAAAEGDRGTSLDELEKEILGASSAPPPEADPIAELEREIDAAVAVKSPEAATREAARPEGAKGTAARKPAGVIGRLGGLFAMAGLALLLVGAVGALVAANYDTWVRGQAASSVGSLQQIGIVAAAALSAAGAVLLLVGGGKLKRKGARAG